MNLIKELKSRIETYWNYLQNHEPFNYAILNGSATPQMMAHFLVNIQYLIQHTPIHLTLAAREAEKKSLPKLKEFFENKIIEEFGHDKWAESDIAVIKARESAEIHDGTIDPSMKRLVSYIEKMILNDPCLYLSYIFFAEYLCVIAGPELTDALEHKCGFPPRSLTVVENHAELDKHHVDEWEDMIQDLVDVDTYSALFLKTLERTIAVHEPIYTSCMPKVEYAVM